MPQNCWLTCATRQQTSSRRTCRSWSRSRRAPPEWAEACLAAGIASTDDRVSHLALQWYAELSGDVGASYAATYRLVLALCGFAALGRQGMVTALLRLLLEHAASRDALHYPVGVLLGTLGLAAGS